MLSYSYTLTPDDNGTYLIQYPDFPEGAAVTEDVAGASPDAADGLDAVLQMYIDARRPIPEPLGGAGDAGISLGSLRTLKILLSNEMVNQGVRKADLARRLGAHPPQIDRLLDLSHNSKIDALESAFEELGRSFEVHLV